MRSGTAVRVFVSSPGLLLERNASATAHTIDVITIDTVPTCLIVVVACIPVLLTGPDNRLSDKSVACGLPTGENPIKDIGSCRKFFDRVLKDYASGVSFAELSSGEISARHSGPSLRALLT